MIEIETGCVFRQSERRFHVIVNAAWMSAAEAADIGSGVHAGIDNGQVPAISCSDLQPTRNVGDAGFVTGGAGGATHIARMPAALCYKRG